MGKGSLGGLDTAGREKLGKRMSCEVLTVWVV